MLAASKLIVLRKNYSSKAKTLKETILNPLNIQILGKSLSEKVFPSNFSNSEPEQSQEMRLNRLQMQTLELSRNHLESHLIPWKKDHQLLPEIPGNFIPGLLGQSGSLKEHFMWMATELGAEYFKLAMEFGKEIERNEPKAPEKEAIEMLLKEFGRKGGWFKWNSNLFKWDSALEGPTDKVIVFDVETSPLISQFPILACAYGSSGWYIWLQSEQDPESDLDKLIPLKHPILVIGHHVAFDRARIKEEYDSLDRRECRFLDTLSMHCAVAGLSSQQRGLWQDRKKRKSLEESSEESSEESLEIEEYDEEEELNNDSTEKWGSRCSMNNLADALKLHCNRKLDKSVRDDILLKSTSKEEIISVLPDILFYCAKDVEATAHLFSVLLPKFLKKSPHAVTFTALLEMGSFILPVEKDSWMSYIETCDGMLEEATKLIEFELNNLVEETVSKGLQGK